MGFIIEILGLHPFHRCNQGLALQQDCTQHGLFGFQVLRGIRSNNISPPILLFRYLYLQGCLHFRVNLDSYLCYAECTNRLVQLNFTFVYFQTLLDKASAICLLVMAPNRRPPSPDLAFSSVTSASSFFASASASAFSSCLSLSSAASGCPVSSCCRPLPDVRFPVAIRSSVRNPQILLSLALSCLDPSYLL